MRNLSTNVKRTESKVEHYGVSGNILSTLRGPERRSALGVGVTRTHTHCQSRTESDRCLMVEKELVTDILVGVIIVKD